MRYLILLHCWIAFVCSMYIRHAVCAVSHTVRVRDKVPPTIIVACYHHVKMEAVCVSIRLKATKRDCVQR